MPVLRVIAVVTLLSACAASGSVEQAMDNLMGKDVQLATDELGAPDAMREHAGVFLYQWTETIAGTMVPSSTDHSAVSMGNRPYRQSTCRLIVQAGPDGRIIAYTWKGNLGVCRPMMGKLVDKYARGPTVSGDGA